MDDGGLESIISEFQTMATDPNTADPNSERVLLVVNQPFPNHKGGQLVFGPDGFLYIGLGDGGSGGDPQGNGQNLSTFLGKMLRIGVDPPFATAESNTRFQPTILSRRRRPARNLCLRPAQSLALFL